MISTKIRKISIHSMYMQVGEIHYISIAEDRINRPFA